MSHVPYKWVTYHINESRTIQMSHVPYKWVTYHINESQHMIISHVTYTKFTSYKRTSTNMKESRLTVSTENTTPQKSTKSRNSHSSVQIQIKLKSRFECVPQDTNESEFLDVGSVAISVEPVIPYKWVTANTNKEIATCHDETGPYVDESWRTWMIHGTYGRVMSRVWMRHVTHMNEFPQIWRSHEPY